MLQQPVTLRVDMTSPMLGVSPLTLVQPAADPIVWRPCPVVLPPPREALPLDDVHVQLVSLRVLTAELLTQILRQQAMIQALQADLAARTWSARWRRFIARFT